MVPKIKTKRWLILKIWGVSESLLLALFINRNKTKNKEHWVRIRFISNSGGHYCTCGILSTIKSWELDQKLHSGVVILSGVSSHNVSEKTKMDAMSSPLMHCPLQSNFQWQKWWIRPSPTIFTLVTNTNEIYFVFISQGELV